MVLKVWCVTDNLNQYHLEWVLKIQIPGLNL